MAYTFLDNSLNTIGVLTNKGGQTNGYWGDSITHEIATSQDVLTSVSLSVDKPSVNIDTSGNQKTWNHVIQGLSFNIDGIGRKVNENDYLIYQEGTNGKYYLMAITQVDESAVQSGFHYKTVQGLNAAAYDLSRKTLRAKSFAQIPDNTQEKGTAQNILKYIFEDINWDVRTIGSFGAVDYDITEGTTAQAVLLDIIGMFEAEVDAYVQLNNWGKGANVFNKNGSIKRIFDFSTSLGKYRGETIRYDKNMVSITKTGARDSMYTKLYVNGNNITIADVNKGADFIVDDVANRKYNKLGAVSTPVTYLEGIITNSAIESPTALLAWGKKQLNILNHPRYNYQISAVNDDKVQLGDTVIIQDTHASEPIYLKSKVISKSVSLADPTSNSFIVGEFSPIVIGADNGLEDTDQIIQLVNQANQTAINAQKKADENAQKIADTRTDLEKTIDQKLQEGKDYSDSLDEKQKEAYDKFEAEVNAGLDSAAAEREQISQKADDMLTQANAHAQSLYEDSVSIAKQEGQNAIQTAGSEAQSMVNEATATAHSEAQQVAQSANQALADAKKDLGDDIQKNHADIVATQEELSSKVSQSDYDAKTQDLETKYAQVKQTADGVTTDVAKYKTDNDAKVSANTAQIKAVSDEVSSKVSKIEYNQKTGQIDESVSQLKQRADGFESTVTKVNDLAVGGRNLFINTATWEKDNRWLWRNSTISGSYGNLSIAQTKNIWDSPAYKIQDLVKRGVTNLTDTYTFSTYARNTSDNDIKIAAYGSTEYMSDMGNSITVLKARGDWQRTSISFKFIKDLSDANFTIRWETGDTLTNGTLQFAGYKLEKGTLATDWTPAPEDVQSGIDTNTSSITQLSNEVETKVAKSDYDKNNQTLNNAISTVDQKADSYNVKLTQYQQTNDGKVSANTQQISVMNGQIDSKVAKTDYDKDKNSFDTQMTAVNQKADGIKASVTDVSGRLDNLSVGGRNLLLDTSKVVTQQGAGADNVNGNFNAGGGRFKFSNNMNTGLFFNKDPKAKYILSYDWLVEDDNPSGQFNPQLTNAPWGFGGVAVMPSKTNKSGHSVTRFETKPSWKDTSAWGIAFRQDHLVGKVTITNMKLELGTVPTDWSPAPEDVEGRVTALELDVNGIHGTVNDPKKGLSATWDLANSGQTLAVQANTAAKTADGKAVKAQNDATTAITTANGTQTTVSSVQQDVKDLQSTTSQTASQVTTEIQDRKNGDTNTLTQANNFTSSSITKSETGMQTKIDQSAAGVVAQVQHVNRLFNTQFTPDLAGWNVTNNGANGKNYNFYRSYIVDGETTVGVNTPADAGSDSSKWYSYFEQDVAVPGNNGGTVISLTWDVRTVTNTNYTSLWFLFLDSNHNQIDSSLNVLKYWNGNADGKWYTKTVENIAVPTNAQYIRVSFQCREGTTAYLKRPMLTFTNTAQTYMPGSYLATDTVLELFDDRFALGIKNNTGNIISGINGDSTGLSIVGKKITVSGDTTFQGSNFMDGAVIKNASISSAKIDTLNVDKLIGNKTEFVKSAWKSAYSNVVIDSTGMSILGGDGVTYIGNGYMDISRMNTSNPKNIMLERIGSFGTSKNVNHTNVDYLQISLDLWGTTDSYGGDGISFAVSQSNGSFQSVLSWESTLSAGYLGWLKGWNFRDYATFHNNLFGPGQEQIGIDHITGGISANALSVGYQRAGIAGNPSDLYFFSPQGGVSLGAIMKKIGLGYTNVTVVGNWRGSNI